MEKNQTSIETLNDLLSKANSSGDIELSTLVTDRIKVQLKNELKEMNSNEEELLLEGKPNVPIPYGPRGQ